MSAAGHAGTDAVSPATVVWAVVTACVVAAPLALGIGVGHDAAGASAALGAYLWTVGHLTVRRPIGIRVATVTVMLLGLAGMTGALAGAHLWVLVVLTVIWATFQAVAETAGTVLRVPVAMSALGFLLSAVIGGASAGGSLWRGVLFLAGAGSAALWELLFHWPGRSTRDGSRVLGLRELAAAWPRSRPFALLLAVPTSISAAVAGAFSISHGAWISTTELRVLRPEVSATLARSGRRIVGTAAGALLAAVLLGTASHKITAVIVLVVCVSAMRLIGPGRYGYYTFFLTLVALELGSVGQRADWHIALIRVGLTLAGAAVAVASGYVFDTFVTRRRPSAGP